MAITNILIQLAVGLVLAFAGYLLMPKPKQEKPPEVQDLERPTADANRPIPVVFGTLQVRSPNFLYADQISYAERYV